MKIVNLTALFLLALVLTGCASSRGGDTYSRQEARQMQQVAFGTVEAVREVNIEGTSGTVGTIAGAGIGGVAGSSIGKGKGSIVGAIAGAVIGGIAGAAAEEGVTAKRGLEITVRMEDTGKMVAIVQEAAEGETYRVGERVRIITSGWESRVSK